MLGPGQARRVSAAVVDVQRLESRFLGRELLQQLDRAVPAAVDNYDDLGKRRVSGQRLENPRQPFAAVVRGDHRRGPEGILSSHAPWGRGKPSKLPAWPPQRATPR